MPKVSQLKTASTIAAEELADPVIRREYERAALAHAVARTGSRDGPAAALDLLSRLDSPPNRY